MFSRSLLLLPIIFGLSGWLGNDTERGAVGGAVIAGATGGSPVTVAVVGGLLGISAGILTCLTARTADLSGFRKA